MSIFARDGFRGQDRVWGGDLVDINTPFASRDKVSHLLAGLLLYELLERWAGAPVPWRLFAAVLVVAIVWELIEWVRLWAGATFAADHPSWRDVTANMVGAVLAWALL